MNETVQISDLERHFAAVTRALRSGSIGDLDGELTARLIEGLWRHNKELTRQLVAAQAEESPPLPLCASCKKIRNGQDDWEEIETYLLERHGLEVSHTICPECSAKLYPE